MEPGEKDVQQDSQQLEIAPMTWRVVWCELCAVRGQRRGWSERRWRRRDKLGAAATLRVSARLARVWLFVTAHFTCTKRPAVLALSSRPLQPTRIAVDDVREWPPREMRNPEALGQNRGEHRRVSVLV